MIARTLLLLSLIASPVAARDYEDEYEWKAPKPLPQIPGQRVQMYVNVEGMKGRFYLTPRLMKKYHLRSGVTISIEVARIIAVELGADYPPDILEKLERIGN